MKLAIPLAELACGACDANKKRDPQPFDWGSLDIKSWRRAIFPGGLPPSIVAADRLYRRVRDGNGCVPAALAPRTF
jgi:hypothetical protein